MTIPALATADKLFICSYNIGSNIDHRYAMSIINELTTVTSEYIDGYCWIPIKAPQELVSHSWFYDLPDKSIHYVKVGCRVSADGYLHAWLLNTQKVSELILWNNAYNTNFKPPWNKSVLHWALEKLYYEVNLHSLTGWYADNIKFQTYIATATTLYLFGNYNNSLTNAVRYTAATADVLNTDCSWYPNNSTTVLGDYLYTNGIVWSLICTRATHSSGKTDWSLQFGKAPDQIEPKFWTITSDTAVLSIDALCDPTTSRYKQVDMCHSLTTIDADENWTAVGNNSGRNYSVGTYTAVICDIFTCSQRLSGKTVRIDMEPNRAYIEDPPGVYSCDPAFTYDTSVSFTYKKFTAVSADSINYLLAMAYFSGIPDSTLMIAEYYYPDVIIDSFDEYNGALDELKHTSFTDDNGRILYSLFTHHVGIGLVTKEAPPTTALNTADWRIYWKSVTDTFPTRAYLNDGGVWIDQSTQFTNATANDVELLPAAEEINDAFYILNTYPFNAIKINIGTAGVGSTIIWEYYNGAWVTLTCTDDTTGFTVAGTNSISFDLPNDWISTTLDGVDGYAIRARVTVASYTTQPLGTQGWINEATKYFELWEAPDGLAIRDPGTSNAVITRPLTHHDEFNTSDDIQGGFCNGLLTSAGFIGRDPGTVTKRPHMGWFNSDFDYLYDLVTSDAFTGRDPGTVTKRPHMGWFNSDFDYLYDLVTSDAFTGRDPGALPLRGNPGTYNMDFCNTGFPWLISPFGGSGGGHYARHGSSIVRFGNSYSTLAATTQTVEKVYEGGEWLNLIVAGDQDELGNTVGELSTKCRVYVGGGWKSVARVGDPVGNGIIVNGCPFFIEMGNTVAEWGIESRFIDVGEGGATEQSMISNPVSYGTDFSDLFSLLDSTAFTARDPLA